MTTQFCQTAEQCLLLPVWGWFHIFMF